MTGNIDEAMRDAFTGNFIDATDLMECGTFTLTIAGVAPPNTERDAANKVIDKTIVAFEKAKKRLILNKVNLNIIALQYGKRPSQWIGKQITLCVRYLKSAFGQKNVPVVRVVPDDNHPMTFGMRKNYGSPTPFTDSD